MFCRKLKLFHLGLIVHASVPVNVNVDELCTVGGGGGGGCIFASQRFTCRGTEWMVNPWLAKMGGLIRCPSSANIYIYTHDCHSYT